MRSRKRAVKGGTREREPLFPLPLTPESALRRLAPILERASYHGGERFLGPAADDGILGGEIVANPLRHSLYYRQNRVHECIVHGHAMGWESLSGKILDQMIAVRLLQNEARVIMRQQSASITVDTPGQGLFDISDQVRRWTAASDIAQGLLTLFCRHTSASLLIHENAAPEARADLERWFARIAPEGRGLYAHDDEGPDDMPAHIRATLTGVQLSIPMAEGRLALGTWQGIYLFEHRRQPHRRTIAMHLIGE